MNQPNQGTPALQPGKVGYLQGGHSAEIGNLLRALQAIQLGEVEVLKNKKANTGGAGNYTYADLEAVYAAVLGPCSQNGIAFSHLIDSTPEEPMAVVTLLVHLPSGEWMRSRAWFPPKTPSPQSYGGIVTYLRRYTMLAMLGLTPEDDDAQGAEREYRQPAKPAADPMASDRARFVALPGNIKTWVQQNFPQEAAGLAFCTANNWNHDLIYQAMDTATNRPGAQR